MLLDQRLAVGAPQFLQRLGGFLCFDICRFDVDVVLVTANRQIAPDDIAGFDILLGLGSHAAGARFGDGLFDGLTGCWLAAFLGLRRTGWHG